MSSIGANCVTDPILSVIVPVYNGASYLEDCLKSIIEQTFRNYELICVNDGSTDRTLDIMVEYKSIDKRIAVISQENRGVSAARNVGLELAKGRYVLFLDGDDWFEPTMFEKMVFRMDKDEADICVCSGWRFDMRFNELVLGKSYLRADYLPSKIPFSISDIGKYLFNFTTFHIYKMYRLSTLKSGGVKFRSFIVSEDALFYSEALLNANLITVVNEPLFYYRVNSGASASSYVSDNILSGYQSLLEIKKLLQNKNMYFGDLKQSFVNKALSSTLHYGRQAVTPESFCTWFYKMRDQGGLASLDILGQDSNYFYNKKEYQKLQELVSAEGPYDLMCAYYRQAIESRDSAKSKTRSLQRRIEQIKKSKSYRLAMKFRKIAKKIKT